MSATVPPKGQQLITSRSFAKKLDKSSKTFARRISAYLKDPSAKEVHNLRTATRRMLVVFNLLPKEMRNKKKQRKLVADQKKLLKLNAKVRDLDIILSKLSKHNQSEAFARLSRTLEKSRKSTLKQARRFAAEIENESFPSIKPGELSGSKLQKRMGKVVRTLDSRIAARLPVVLADPMGKEALHLLRVDTRRLRYTIELEQTPKTNLVSFLRSWQNTLGAIHDCDVFIEYFHSGNEPPEIQDLLEDANSERSRYYRKFFTLAKERPSFTRLDLVSEPAEDEVTLS